MLSFVLARVKLEDNPYSPITRSQRRPIHYVHFSGTALADGPARPQGQDRPHRECRLTLYPASPLVASLLSTRTLQTGGSGDIGKATAILFKRADCNVIITGSNRDKLDKALNDMTHLGDGGSGKVWAFQCDIRDRKEVEEMVRKTVDECPPIDILINNVSWQRWCWSRSWVSTRHGNPLMLVGWVRAQRNCAVLGAGHGGPCVGDGRQLDGADECYS